MCKCHDKAFKGASLRRIAIDMQEEKKKKKKKEK